MSGNNNHSNNGPCGACKLLRRKCVKGCVFAPYFDQEQGTAQFAAVHKVFGASNASKLLLRIPPQKRVDAVVTLSYEAFARARDPVYGCVAHIFTLQQQVMNLQAELAYTQARLTTLQRLPPPPPTPPPPHPLLQWPQTSSRPSFHSTSEFQSCTSTNAPMMSHFDQPTNFQSSSHHQMSSICQFINQDLEDDGDDLEALAREFVAKYLPTTKTRPSPSSSSQ